jgi:predicted LPLAT superfamily acyltransferase
MTPTKLHYRIPGPTWGYAALTQVQRIAPRWLLRAPFVFGTWIAVARMPEQRRQSRDFLRIALGRPVGVTDVWRHFFTYFEFLLLRLRIADNVAAKVSLDPEGASDFETLMASGEQALFGTFHFGHSDLLGFLLPRRGRRVAMVRLRVGNSGDTDRLEEQFRDGVSFIWVNEPESLLFAMKRAIDRGDSLAMQCDRLYSSRTEAFHFLGAQRVFPFAIYHLALMFNLPVMFCVGLPGAGDGTHVVASPIFRPDAAQSRAQNLERACEHFQAVLTRLETLVRQHPYHWFNFIPLNPVASTRNVKAAATLSTAGPD